MAPITPRTARKIAGPTETVTVSEFTDTVTVSHFTETVTVSEFTDTVTVSHFTETVTETMTVSSDGDAPINPLAANDVIADDSAPLIDGPGQASGAPAETGSTLLDGFDQETINRMLRQDSPTSD